MNFKKTFMAVLSAALLLPATAMAQFNWPYQIKDGTIVTKVPERPAGQKDVLNLATAKLPVLRVGFVGLGMRGHDAVRRWCYQEGVEIKGLCDHEADRAEASNELLRKAGLPPASLYSGEEGYKALCERPDVDLIYIAVDWEHHVPVAEYAMEHGKHVAIEVPSAMNLTEIWKLIDLSEQKRVHCMMLENCCYDFFELNALNMAQKGLFGDVIFGQGAYRHDLDPFWDAYWKRDANDKLGWRLDYNMKYRGDVYATHGLGPVAQIMNIHRGDRFTVLSAMDTKSFLGVKKAEQRLGHKVDNFRQGDLTNTMIRTEQGKVIQVVHDVMTPQPYSRMFHLVGTKGIANKYPSEGIALNDAALKQAGIKPSTNYYNGEAFLNAADMQALNKKFESPIITKYNAKAREVGGHGGMDFIEDSRLVYCLQHGLPLDMDVYDLAEWCSLAELGSLSMDHNCMPVAVPDFTRGHWNDQKGYRHAFASAEDEAAQDKANHEFTVKLKATAEKAWKKFDKQQAKIKAAKAKAAAKK
ncbi:MAG TPA: glycosyl hydrolase [Prevotella sp.]|nr:glycosyl hydrolase [Prevotella sp.]